MSQSQHHQTLTHNILSDIDADLVIISASPFGIQDDAQRVINFLNDLYDDDVFMSSLSSDDIDWMESLMKDAEALYASFSENNYVEEEAEEPNARPFLTYFEQLLGILLGASCMAIIVWLFTVITILAFGG